MTALAGVAAVALCCGTALIGLRLWLAHRFALATRPEASGTATKMERLEERVTALELSKSMRRAI